MNLASKSACIGLFAAVISTQVFAQAGYVDATVTRIQVASDNTYGGCSATLSVNVSNSGLNCSSKLVTFDCQKEWLTASQSQSLLNQAQRLYVTGNSGRFHVDDTRKHRYCLAYRVDAK